SRSRVPSVSVARSAFTRSSVTRASFTCSPRTRARSRSCSACACSTHRCAAGTRARLAFRTSEADVAIVRGMHLVRSCALATVFAALSCSAPAPPPPKEPPPSAIDLDAERHAINGVLDDWHDAAAKADEERYFSHFAESAVFLGTDATERWDTTAFRSF